MLSPCFERRQAYSLLNSVLARRAIRRSLPLKRKGLWCLGFGEPWFTWIGPPSSSTPVVGCPLTRGDARPQGTM